MPDPPSRGGPQPRDRFPPALRGLIAGVVIGTALAGVIGTCIVRQVVRSADALGGVLAMPGALPRPGAAPAPTPAPGLAPRAAREPPAAPDLSAPAREPGPSSADRNAPEAEAEPPRSADLGTARDRPGSATLTSGEAPPARLVAEAGVSAQPPARDRDDASTRAVADGGAIASASAAIAASATGGAGPFLTEPPPWGASAYESNPEAGAGRFGTDRSPR
jgi:hypothetical protein